MYPGKIDTTARRISFKSEYDYTERKLVDKKNEYNREISSSIEEILEFISLCEDETVKKKMEKHLDQLRNRLEEFRKGERNESIR